MATQKDYDDAVNFLMFEKYRVFQDDGSEPNWVIWTLKDQFDFPEEPLCDVGSPVTDIRFKDSDSAYKWLSYKIRNEQKNLIISVLRDMALYANSLKK